MGILSYLRVLLNPTNTDHLLIDQPTHRPPIHRLTYPTFTDPTNNIVLKKDLAIERNRVYRTQTQWEKAKLYFGLYSLN